MSILSYLATFSGIIGGLANIPQIYRIFSRKSAKDISSVTQLIFISISIIWTLYGIEIGNLPIIITNLVWILTYIVILIGIIRFRK